MLDFLFVPHYLDNNFRLTGTVCMYTKTVQYIQCFNIRILAPFSQCVVGRVVFAKSKYIIRRSSGFFEF